MRSLVAVMGAMAVLFVAVAAPGAETVKLSTAAPHEAALITGLRLIKEGKFDEWIATRCSKTKKCINEPAKVIVKQRLQALRPRNCLRDSNTSIVVTKSESSDQDKKVFVQCEEDAMPLPFRMTLENGLWLFAEL